MLLDHRVGTAGELTGDGGRGKVAIHFYHLGKLLGLFKSHLVEATATIRTDKNQ